MPLVSILIIFMVVGVLLWAINTYVPMEPGIKKLMNIVVFVVMVLWVLQIFGLLGGLEAVRVGPSGVR